MDDKIFHEIAASLQDLPGGSGHLASFHLDRASFRITRREDRGDGIAEICFTVDAEYLSEFTDYQADIPLPKQTLSGRAVFGADFRILRDAHGRPQISL